MIPYEVVRSKRKTIAMQINPQGKVIVRAPLRCSEAYIHQFVLSHGDWLEDRYEKMQSLLSRQREFRLREGDQLPFCGTYLRVIRSEKSRVKIDSQQGTILLPDLPVAEIRDSVIRALSRSALPFFRERLKFWGNQMGISYGEVSISHALRRWGSCSANGNIHFSWMLIFAPERAIDYVMVHELAHRREFNHSAAFWQIVAGFIPDYRQQRKALVPVQETLIRQGWCLK